MIFDSWTFALFLPLVAIVYWALRSVRAQNVWLCLASYVFYGAWDWRFLGLIALSTGLDFFCARRMGATEDQRKRRRYLTLSLIGNLGVLGVFKYLGWFVASMAALLDTLGLPASVGTLEIVLPVGISFYTFQTLGYTIDVYRRDLEPCEDLLDFALYVAFFPQLVAGPIERASRLLPQLRSARIVTNEKIAGGAWLILQGLFKKVALADTIAPLVDEAFANPGSQTSSILWRGAYLFAFQIYFDFAGYSDIARGVSRLLGVELMENFRQPFFATSYTDLWRRWHVSLSSWFRDYVYIPLGGNRGGRWFCARNILLTMTISGLWHGASWTMVAWGLANGLILMAERLFRGHQGRQPVPPSWRVLPQMLVTFHLFVFIFIFFRARSFTDAFDYFAGMTDLKGLAGDLGTLYRVVFYGAFLVLFDLPAERSGHHLAILRWPVWIRGVLIGLLLILLVVFSRGADIPFIYFQF